jgi:hypothetical protein
MGGRQADQKRLLFIRDISYCASHCAFVVSIVALNSLFVKRQFRSLYPNSTTQALIHPRRDNAAMFGKADIIKRFDNKSCVRSGRYLANFHNVSGCGRVVILLPELIYGIDYFSGVFSLYHCYPFCI